jgi:hypothetical protein
LRFSALDLHALNFVGNGFDKVSSKSSTLLTAFGGSFSSKINIAAHLSGGRAVAFERQKKQALQNQFRLQRCITEYAYDRCVDFVVSRYRFAQIFNFAKRRFNVVENLVERIKELAGRPKILSPASE